MLHDVVLILHSWDRWVAIIAGILATVMALAGRGDSRNSRAGLIFTIALDLQFVFGILLLLTSNAFGDMGKTMADPTARFYAVEHPTMMIVAIALAHVGRVMARKATTSASARTKSIIFFGLSTLLLLVGTPWPGTHDNRPLFKL